MGVTAGGVAGPLLMTDQHVAQLRRVEERVVDRQDRTPGDAEDQVDAEFLQGTHDSLGTGELDWGYPLGGMALG